MANVTVRHFALYLRKKKAATAETIAADVDFGRSPMYGSEGLLTFSKGAKMWTITIGGPAPVSGSDLSEIIEKLDRQEDIECKFLCEGKLYGGDMAGTKAGWNSDSKNGEAKNSYTLQGLMEIIG